MKKALLAVLAGILLLFLASSTTEANHRNWGGYVSIGAGGYWQAGLYHHHGRSYQPGIWIGGHHFPTAPDFNWRQNIWVLGDRGHWQNNWYRWQNNWYQAPLYQGGHFFSRAPRQVWQNQCQWRYDQCRGWWQDCRQVLVSEPHHCNRWCQ